MPEYKQKNVDRKQNIGIAVSLFGSLSAAVWTYAVHLRSECVQAEVPKIILEISRADALIDSLSDAVLYMDNTVTAEIMAIAVLMNEKPDIEKVPAQIANMMAAMTSTQNQIESIVNERNHLLEVGDERLEQALSGMYGSTPGSACDMSNLQGNTKKLQTCPAAIRETAENVIYLFQEERDGLLSDLASLERCDSGVFKHLF